MSELRVVASERAPTPPSVGRINMLSGDQKGREYQLRQQVTRMGRGINNDIVIADPQASRKHLEIIRENERYVVVDSGSANGFYLNDQQTKRAYLNNGDIITIGLVRMQIRLGDNLPDNPTSVLTAQPPPDVAPTVGPGQILIDQAAGLAQAAAPRPVIDERHLEEIDLRARPATTFGRELRGNDIVMDNPQVSRHHARIVRQPAGYVLTDLRSTNGTFVNDQLIGGDTLLNDGDILNVGPYRYMFQGGELWRNPDDDNIRVDVLGLKKLIKGNINLLQDVTFTILPREFVCIVGGSGTGKSTLLDAISGVRPATNGEVLFNKTPYYPQMATYRSAVGYVPQDDIVPLELTVYRALYYAARLRLPESTSEAEIEERLNEVIDDLGLEQRRDTPIRLLSGGQRKRVSIAAELISKPSLLFLDEPTSGLDPGLEKRMMELLRKLADQGRTVILITHATENVNLCDRVLFLARGGYVAFYGSPDDALTYFGVKKFPEIYNMLERERTPEEWSTLFQQSPYYQRNVLSRLRAIAEFANKYGLQILPPGQGSAPIATAPTSTYRPAFKPAQVTVPALKQFTVLTRRYFETMTRDRKNLLILLLQAPIIALMLIIVFNRQDWNPQTGDVGNARTLIFLLAIVSVWFGTSNSAREIVKEAAIYRRERRIGLKIAPYVFSKLVIQTLLILVQIIILLGLIWLGIGLGATSLEFMGYIFLSLFLTALSAVTLGLLLSAINNNSDRVTSFVPLVLIPQIIFSGAIVALDKMGAIGTLISHLMSAKWSYQALGSLSGLDNIPTPKIKFSGPPPELAGQIEKLFNGGIRYESPDWVLIPNRELEFNSVNVYANWGILALIIIICVALIFVFQLRKDKDYSR